MRKPFSYLSQWPVAEPAAEAETWEVTRQQVGGATQIVGDQEDYLADASRDIGRRLVAGSWELFVSCDPAQAMLQQFQRLQPEFVAVHDVGTASSRQLLAGVAAAAGTLLQKLVIRRQGYGVALATLQFVELPGADGTAALRLYSTEVDADTLARQQLARVLLAHSRLGAVMVGDLPPHALKSALRPLRDAIVAGPWQNRQLLMLPLASGGALANEAAQLAMGTGVTVRTTPQVTRPADAWQFIDGAWNRLRGQPPGAAAPPPAPAPAAPAAPAAAPVPLMQLREPPPLQRYVQQCSELKGMLSCCVFELATHRTVAHAGGRPGPAALATQGAALLAALGHASQSLGLGREPLEAAVTLADHHLLLRAVPRHAGHVLHAVLDRHAAANLAVVRLGLQRLDESL